MRRFLLALAISSLLLASPGAFARERVVVLRNGNTFTGQVLEQQRQVVVQQGTSELAFELNEIEMIAGSLDDVYRKMAARVPRGNRVAREKLITWCIQQHLPQFASLQLKILRQEHPSSPDWELWQRRIDSHAELGGKNVLPPAAPSHPDAVVAEQIGDQLGKPAQALFVRKIQPILLNRCGLASCHGRATSSNYRLVRARAPIARSITQRNLGASLRQIRNAPAQQSLLWLSANEIHGGAKKTVITEPELAQLLSWIAMVTQDLSGEQNTTPAVQQPVTPVADPFDPTEFNEGAD